MKVELEKLRDKMDKKLLEKGIKTKIDDSWGQWRLAIYHENQEIFDITSGLKGFRIHSNVYEGRNVTIEYRKKNDIIFFIDSIIFGGEVDYLL